MKRHHLTATLVAVMAFFLPACHQEDGHSHHEHHKIVATTPKVEDVVITQQYVCQIHSQRHIEVCALESGYIQDIAVKEGQSVKQGDVLFKVLPTLYQAKLDAEQAEARLAQLKYANAKRLYEQNVVSVQEVALLQAELDKAQAKANLAAAELNFTDVKAPYSGIVDRLQEQLGSLVNEGDVLTTLSDNSVLWVYFNVPEAQYLEYMSNLGGIQPRSQSTLQANAVKKGKDDDDDDVDDEEDDDEDDKDDVKKDRRVRQEKNELQHIELVLANGRKFPYPGAVAAIEAKFNNETGTIPFRADFPNPQRLLRHGQTGNVLIHETLKDAIVIPQRCVFEVLDKTYVFVVDEEDIVRQREIIIGNEKEDIFVVSSGLAPGEKIVLDGVRQVHDGEKVEFQTIAPTKAMSNQKFHAE